MNKIFWVDKAIEIINDNPLDEDKRVVTQHENGNVSIRFYHSKETKRKMEEFNKKLRETANAVHQARGKRQV